MRHVTLALSLFLSVAAAAFAAADTPTIVNQFLAREEPAVQSVRARRRLEAQNVKFKKQGWMEVVTTQDAAGFTYRIVGEGGAEYVRNKVLRKALEREKEAWEKREAAGASLSEPNYIFDAATDAEGLVRVQIQPRRKDPLLVKGALFFTPDADLVRVEGTLAKNPSFWTREVHVVRRYGRIQGVRLPVSMESIAQVMIAGRSTFSMTYQYEEVNGRPCEDDQSFGSVSRGSPVGQLLEPRHPSDRQIR